MKPSAFAYHAPRSVPEAVEVLGELGEDAKVLAGGQSLVPLLNMRLASPRAVVDLARVTGLDAVEVDGTNVRVEARVTQERLRRDPRAVAAVPMLRETLGLVAHAAIRNRGTVLGSIVHADPAAELPALLALLGGHVELTSRHGERTVPGDAFSLGPLESDTRADELAAAVTLPVTPPRSGAAFVELARRHGDYAIAGVGVLVTLDPDHRIGAARAVCIGVGGRPHLVDVTPTVAGQRHDALDPAEAAALARSAIDPTDDIHATATYRRHLVGVLLGRALVMATRRAVGEGE